MLSSGIAKGHWRCSGVFIVNFEHISHLVLVLLLLTLSRQIPTGNASQKGTETFQYTLLFANYYYRLISIYPLKVTKVRSMGPLKDGKMSTFLSR